MQIERWARIEGAEQGDWPWESGDVGGEGGPALPA